MFGYRALETIAIGGMGNLCGIERWYVIYVLAITTVCFHARLLKNTDFFFNSTFIAKLRM